MLPKVLNDYGGQRVNAKPVSNPTSQYDADKFNRAHEDIAQATRTIDRAIVSFVTSLAGDPDPLLTIHRSVWGLGAPQKPVVTRTGMGLYLVTYAGSFDDGLGLPDSIEAVTFAFPPEVSVMSSDNLDEIYARPFAFTANTFSIQTESPPGTLEDRGSNSGLGFTVIAKIV